MKARQAAVALVAMTAAAGGCARRVRPDGAAEARAAAGTPTLERLVPDSIVVMKGMVAEVQIRGQRFDVNRAVPGNTVSVGNVVLNGVPANAGGTVILFVVPDEVRSGGEAPPAAWVPGKYAVTVRTSRGLSDTLYLTISTGSVIRP